MGDSISVTGGYSITPANAEPANPSICGDSNDTLCRSLGSNVGSSISDAFNKAAPTSAPAASNLQQAMQGHDNANASKYDDGVAPHRVSGSLNLGVSKNEHAATDVSASLSATDSESGINISGKVDCQGGSVNTNAQVTVPIKGLLNGSATFSANTDESGGTAKLNGGGVDVKTSIPGGWDLDVSANASKNGGNGSFQLSRSF